jgi:hypothetical protein
MLEKKELLNLTPQERDVVLLFRLWPFLFKAEKPSIALIVQKTTHSEEFIKTTFNKIHRMTRLKLEIADFNTQLKKLIEEIYAE